MRRLEAQGIPTAARSEPRGRLVIGGTDGPFEPAQPSSDEARDAAADIQDLGVVCPHCEGHFQDEQTLGLVKRGWDAALKWRDGK